MTSVIRANSGQIALAVASGFPPPVLIPIAPPTAPFREGQAGKVPAIYTDRGWTFAQNWSKGIHAAVRDEADLEGCNCGLLLGFPFGSLNLIAFDIDTEPHPTDAQAPETVYARKIAACVLRTIRSFRDEHGLSGKRHGDIWVRRTRPGRAAVLFNLPPNESAGVKHKGYLTSADGRDLGKIELLAAGQQIVIGGMHPYKGGTPIDWIDMDATEDPALPYPDLRVSSIAAFETRAQADECLRAVFDALHTAMGVQLTRYTTPGASQGGDDTPMPPEALAAENVDAFTEAFEAIPHDVRTNREAYVKIMRAASTCIKAMVDLGRADDDEATRMAGAAVAWAARWVDPVGVGTTVEEEQEKWDSDFNRHSASWLGWCHILKTASDLGCADFKQHRAQTAFAADLVDAPVSVKELLGEERAHEIAGVPKRRKGSKVGFDVKTSDIQIADFVESRLGKSIAWVPDAKNGYWIAWGGAEHGGWSTPNAIGVSRTRIADQLVYYVERFSQSFGSNDDTRAKLTSESRVRAIESLLKARLAISPENINRSIMTLQTPTGMIYLPTGDKLSWEEQRRSTDTRCTLVDPKAGVPYPRFAALIEHLSCGDAEVARWIWAYIGYALLGRPREHLFVVIKGPGENGKTVLINVLNAILASYSSQIDRKVLAASGNKDHPTALAAIKGRRLWTVSEFDQEEKWNEAQLKALSGGDTITARGMNENMANIHAEGSFLIASNHIPSLQRVSQAVVRRFRIVNARVPISPDKRNPNLQNEILEEEAAGILSRMITEAQKIYANNGMMPAVPAAIVKETQQYFASQDVFFTWFQDQCLIVMENEGYPSIPVDDLHRRYANYAKRLAKADTGRSKSGRDDELLSMIDDGPTLGIGGFVAALRRVGALVDIESVPYKAVSGATEYEKRRVARGIRLKVSEVNTVVDLASVREKEKVA